MKTFKRILSIIIAVIMILSITVPVFAYDLKSSEFNLYFKVTSDMAGQHEIEVIKANESFFLQVMYKGNTAENNVAAIGLELFCNRDLVEPNAASKATEAPGSMSSNLNNNGYISIAWANAEGLNGMNDEMETVTLSAGRLAVIKFTAKEGISQSQIADFVLSTDGDHASYCANVNKERIDFTASDLALPVLAENSILVYSEGETTVAAPTLAGGNVTVSFKAITTGENGTAADISETATWSVDGSSNGVTVDKGVVTVTSAAGSGTYNIKASFEGKTGSATLTVTKEDLVATSITVSGGSTGPIYVPGDKDEDATATFTATVTDQYGVVMTNPDVAWSIDPKVDGISIAGGVLTVTNAAKTSIDTTGKTLTVTATCDGKSDTAEITVKRAASTHSSIEILKGDKAITSDNIAAGETGNYTAKYYDQYGYQMDPPAEVTPNWEISNFNECDVGDFSLSPSGEHGTEVAVSVKDDVKNGASATLTVSENNLSDSITINVNALTFTAEPGAVTFYYPEGEKAVYGPTWEELVQIDQDKITATYNGEKVKGTYYLKVSEDYGSTFNVVDQKARPVCDSSIALYMCSIYFDSEDETFKDIYVAKHCTSSTNVPDISFSLYPKPVTVSGITATDKVYDGTTVAELNTNSASIGGKVGNDDVTIDVANATGTFDTKNVGTGKTVTITDITLGGNDAGNYTLSSDSATATADITAKTVTVSGITASNKVYDGNTSATIETSGAAISDIVGNDDVTIDVAKATGTFEDKNVGTRKTVTITGIALGGADKDNYTLTSDSANATASITASSNINASVNETQNVVVGVGDFTEPTFTGVTVNGVAETVAGTVTYTIGDNSGMDYYAAKTALAQKTKGTEVAVDYSFTPTDSNYTGNITGTINVTMVDIAFTGVEEAITVATDAVYGDTWGDIVTVDASKITAKVGDTEIKDGTYTVKDASVRPDAGTATWVVQFTGTLGDKTYTNVTVATGTVDVAQKVLTISGISAEDKEYNGNTDATVTGTATLNGVLEGDTVTVTDGAAEFASKNAGQQTVTFSGFSIEGNGASNYTLIQPAPVIATISPKSVTIENVAVSDKTYDGNRDATIANSGTISGIISSDNVTIQSGTGTFASADVGTGITVTFSSFSLSGDDAGNYTLSAQPASTTADITKANYTGTPNTVNVNVLINQSAAQTGSVSIDQFFQTIPAGAVITSVAPVSGSVMASVSVADGVVSYSSKANLETEGVKDTYSVTIETKNYNNIEAALTFTTVAKTPVNISGVSVTGAGKTYDGKAVSYTGTPAAKTNDGTTVTVTGTYSYVWQKADGTALASAPKDAGSYKLVITLDDPAYIGSAEVSFTIAKAKITITAEDAEAYTGSDMPKLSYTVSGLATGEKLAKEPSVSCAADMKKAGSYVIAVSGAEVPNTNNYEESITYVSGTLEVKNRPVNIGPTYDIKVLDSAHGTVRASLGNASEGSTIRLTVTPDEGYSLANLIVRDERGRRIDVAKSGGVYRFVMPAGDVTIEAVFAQGTTVLPFTDVSTYDWFYEYVKYVYDNGIMDGIDVGVFGPGITTTRAMLVTMLYRVAGEPYVSGTNDFADVAANTWYTDAVTWASKNGIVTGVDVGVFNPNGAITREQLATILYRYAEYVGEGVSARASLSRFTDTGSISAYARDAVSWAVAEGILDGRTATELAPTGECTRAEVATMIARAFG